MNVLMLSTDAKILDATSAVSLRMQKYAESFGKLTIIVFARGEKTRLEPRGKLSVYCSGGNRLTSYVRGLKAALWFEGDVISSQDPFELGFLGLYAAHRKGLPIQIQVHTDLSRAFMQAGLRQRVQVWIARFVLPRADCVRVVSERAVKNMYELGLRLKRPPVVLPVFVDVHHFEEGERSTFLKEMFPEFSHIALWVGRLEYEKDPQAMVHAFVEVLRAEPLAGLIFLGEGSKKDELKRLAASFGIAASIKFMPFADPKPYYKSADVLVVTSRYEGFGMALVEALASQLPVVSYDVGVAAEAGARVITPALLPQAIIQSFKSPHTSTLPERFRTTEEKHLLAYTEALRTCGQKA